MDLESTIMYGSYSLEADASHFEPCRKRRRLADESNTNLLSVAVMNLMGRPTTETWRKVLQELDTCYFKEISVEEELLSSLHRTLLVHVGYILSLATCKDDGANQDLILVLCQSWQRVYDLFKILQTHRIKAEEYNETVDLLSQVLERYHANVEIVSKCVNVAHHVEMQFGDLKTDGSREERFLFSILIVGAKEEPEALSETALLVLKEAAKSSSIARIVYTAARVIQTIENDSHTCSNSISVAFEEGIDSELYMLGLLIATKSDPVALTRRLASHPSKDILLFLRGVSVSSKVAVHLSQSKPVIELIYSIGKKDEYLSRAATSCLSSIAGCGESSEIVADKLIALFSLGSFAVKHIAIPGVCTILEHDNMESLDRHAGLLLPVLSDLVLCDDCLDDNNNRVSFICDDAARLVCLMTRQLSKREKWSTVFKSTLFIMSILVESGEVCVVDTTLECVLELSSKRALIRKMARLNSLLEAIARAVLNEFNATETKTKAIQVFWNLSHDESNLPILARTPKVLEALIAISSTHAEATAMGNTRQCALQTLLRLSELVSNRRILAKQVGLLACLIRFTRSSVASDQETHLLPKEKLKERILEIAILL